MQTDGMSQQTAAGKGVDLRTVSAGNVESMEVIRGIPSVEYGNLTSGVVVVKTKAGQTPWEAKFQVDPNSKLAFAEKGFNLKKGGAANFSVDWSQSWADTRKHYMGYDRITASAGYSNQFGPVSFNVKGSFYSNINNRKDDPQFAEQKIHYKNINTGARLSVSGLYKPTGGFLSSLDYNLSTQMSRTLDKHDNWVNNPDGLVTTSREPGVHIAQIRNVGYTSAYQIEGIPINVYAQVVANKYLQLSENDYVNLKLGAEYTYDVNKGAGFTYDENNPPQAQGSQTLRPRSYKDIPASHTLSGFASGRLHEGFGTMSLLLEAGVRVSNMFVDRAQSGGISHFLVGEPRINATLNLLNHKNNSVFDQLSLTGGFGISNKMPTLMYLYPDSAYFDNASLSKYGEEEKDRLGLITTDVVRNTANPDLKPVHSTKWEVGLSFRIRKVQGFATFFHEYHQHELGFISQLIWQNFDKYTVPATATDPVFDAASGNVTYRMDGAEYTAARTKTTELFTWNQASNSTTTSKHGIEYGLDFGEIKPLRTSLNISGAWFQIKRTDESTSLKYINSSFDYVGVLPSGAGSVSNRFNSTFRLITHITAIKMIFTTSVQVVWYESSQTIYQDENGNNRYYLKSYEDKDYLVVDPIGYYDKQGNYTAWNAADANDADKARIMYRTQPYLYEKDVIEPWALLSFRFTKEIGKVAELSVIANNFTNTKKWHTNPHSMVKTQLYP
ncbi:MAG: TonB-dependent receptor, partial [Paraprevotella sp.]|nr:TonB-dependent receptor [Paraprevotella sp.]